MTPYEHRWAWARSLKVDEMDKFIEEHPDPFAGTVVIWYKGVEKTHHLIDVMEVVRFCREEYRKDKRMETPVET